MTDKELYDIMVRDFASKQYDAIKDYSPSYSELRYLYYKSCDEEIIAKIINKITFRYAKCETISEIRTNGEIKTIIIPYEDAMNFVSLAKAQHLKFHFDVEGYRSTPSFDTIGVIINDYEEPRVKRILARIIEDKINYSHAITDQQKMNLIMNRKINHLK